MPDTLNSILEELRSKITIQGLSNHDIALAHQKIEELMLSEEEISNLALFELESGGWCLMSTYLNSGDVKDLGKAIHNSMLKKLR
jgi:peptidyl-tRNA hydrolase